MSIKERVEIFDTTLRDGLQCGINLSLNDKLKIADSLENLGVDTIEAGFPSSNTLDFEFIKHLSNKAEKPYICGLSRIVKKDVDIAYKALENAKKKTIHLFTPNIDPHSLKAYNLEPKNLITNAIDTIKYARDKLKDGRIEFSAQNLIFALNESFKQEYNYIKEIISELYTKAIEQGVDIINLPNTVQKGIMFEVNDLIKEFKRLVPDYSKTIMSFHGHNDFGDAVYESKQTLFEGIRQIECTINGIGERAGNTPLEEVVLGISEQPKFSQRFYTNINLSMIKPISKLVEEITMIPNHPNKPIVGENALAHGSGIHADGENKGKSTGSLIYLAFSPEKIGAKRSKFIINKLTGTSAIKTRLEILGYSFDDDYFIADNIRGEEFIKHYLLPIIKQSNHNWEDFELRMLGDAFRYGDDKKIGFYRGKIIEIEDFKIQKNGIYQSKVYLKTPNNYLRGYAESKGAINSLFSAVDNALQIPNKPKVVLFSPKNLGKTHASDAEVRIVLSNNCNKINYSIKNNSSWVGIGRNLDTLKASIEAYAQALSRYVVDKRISLTPPY
jgi:2-isopropylmalate synthase